MCHSKWGILAVLALMACSGPATVEWTEGEKRADGRAEHTLVLRNVPGGARVWFQELYGNLEVVSPEGLAMPHYQGTSRYIDLPADASKTFTIKYLARPLPRHSWAPEGFVMQRKGHEDQPLEVTYHFLDRKGTPVSADWYAARYEVQPGDLIPRPKRVTLGTEKAGTDEPRPAGWYRITICGGESAVESADREGEIYARQTLEKLPEELPDMVIEDWPDLGLRGFMLDVVRDFRSKDEVLKVLDIMASYKVNMLHFHLGDDEAWCLDIPTLPDLTAFSGHHALPDWDLQETRALKPMANGHIGNTTFYTEAEYKEILQHAWERGISVVPEFDAPGHSRSSIKAMQAYERRTGDSSFRLQDPADTSRYWSAQDFTDNVLDPDYPGVYKFYGVVFDEVIRMHKEAGVPLLAIHIGGDEVPGGTWAGRDRKQMKDKFTRGILALAQERGIKLAGWQEMVQGIEPETLETLKKQLLFVNAWSTRGDDIELTYRLANEGIPVLLSNVQNAYVDLAYTDDPEIVGLHWGGYVDERKAFALQPWKIYESVRWEGVDTPVDWAHAAQGRPQLLKPEMIVGAEALLWSENLRNFQNTTFQMLPKALGIWERAWNSRPDWPTDEAFAADFDRFYSIVKKVEMPRWEAAGYTYRAFKTN